jgi:hypothetical protein
MGERLLRRCIGQSERENGGEMKSVRAVGWLLAGLALTFGIFAIFVLDRVAVEKSSLRTAYAMLIVAATLINAGVSLLVGRRNLNVGTGLGLFLIVLTATLVLGLILYWMGGALVA